MITSQYQAMRLKEAETMEGMSKSAGSPPKRRRLIHFSAIFIPVVLLFSLALGSVLYVDYTRLKEELRDEEYRLVTLVIVAIQSYFTNVATDMQSLSRESDLREVVNGLQESAPNVEGFFANFASRRLIYDQLRVIDTTGREVINVTFRGGQSQVVPDADLRNQASQPYFTRAMELENGAIDVSRIQLDTENGVIEQPPRPVIRVATPLFDDNGRRWGLLVANINGGVLIQALRNQNANTHGQFWMLNQQGYWLVGPNPEDEWAFMYPDRADRTLIRQNPRLWSQLTNNPSAAFEHEGDLYTRIPLCVDLSCRIAFAEQFASDTVETDLPENALHIVTHVPASTLAFVSLIPRSLGQWVPLSLLLAAIASIVGVVAWRLAGTVDRLNLQDSQLQSERENLELKVASRTEELEKEKERAELANKAKSSFLATMSHEIRTPMNGVIGLVDVLRLSSLRPKQMEQVGLIRDSAYSLLTIIDDILDFSKIEAGKITLETEPVTLSYLSESVSSAMAVVAQQRGVELTFYRSPKLPLAVVSDAVRLRQIITNLVGNAVKFSSGLDRPGRVSVRLEAPNEAFIQLTVKDNGIGMRRESVESLFKAFTQADASTTRRFGGSGLGLVITKRLVTLMGGTISVESEEGVGTTFTVELPVIVTTMAASPKFSHSLEGTRVYLSGDNAELVTDWLTYLQQAGARDVQSMETARLSDMDKLQAADDKETLIVVLDDKDANLRERYLALSDTLKDRHNSRLFVISRLSDVRVNNVNEYLTILQRDSSHAKSFTDFLATVAGVDLRWDEPGFESVKRVSVSRDDAIASNKLVLVAEDNEINQQVIRNQLDLLGYAYDIAKDGREALEFWYANEHDYALILTDIHMPVLDGYQLTATIRGQEQAEPRIPILALTANATKGEKARCLEMGMNDYFTKPVPLEELESSLAAWSNGRQEAANLADQADPAGTSSSSGIDFSLITRYLGDNREQISLFLAKYAKSIEKSRVMVQSAYNNGDWKEIGNITHTLKSTSRSVGALALGDLCAELEKSCNALDEPAIHEAMRTFQSKIDDVMQAIAAREEETDASG